MLSLSLSFTSWPYNVIWIIYALSLPFITAVHSFVIISHRRPHHRLCVCRYRYPHSHNCVVVLIVVVFVLAVRWRSSSRSLTAVIPYSWTCVLESSLSVSSLASSSPSLLDQFVFVAHVFVFHSYHPSSVISSLSTSPSSNSLNFI